MIEFESMSCGTGFTERVKDGKRTLIRSIVQKEGKTLRSGSQGIALDVTKDK